jgi:hypothetical protein
VKRPKLYLIEPADRAAFERAELQANRAQKAFIARGGAWNDPTAPYWKWVTIGYKFPSYRTQHEAGRKDAALSAIRDHIIHEVPLPRWAGDAFLRAMRDVTNYRVGSWDAVFGKRLKKGQHLSRLREKRQNAVAIYNDIVDSIHRGRAIDFEAIGRKHGVGATRAKEYYRDQCKLLGNPTKRKRLDEWPRF